MSTATRSKLAFLDRGRGQALVLVHAFPLDGRMWQAQMVELESAARVLVPDLRGFGRSADVPAPVALDEHADDIAALLDELGIERAAVLGMSMGGYIALAFARRHRTRLAALGLANTRATADDDQGKRGRNAKIAQMERDGVASVVDEIAASLLSPSAPAAVVERVREIVGSQTAAGLRAAQMAMRDRIDSTPLLAQLDVPTMVIASEKDTITPVAVARAMADAIPRAELTVLSDAGHLSNLEAPRAFTASVRKLLEKLPTP